MANMTPAQLDLRQSPVGFYLLGIDYLGAADAVASRHIDGADRFRLKFEDPIRHLYAHGWELVQKACLFQQGMKPSEMKRRLGHRLADAWDLIDRDQFPAFNLHDDTRIVPEYLDQFHHTKMYAYPVLGHRRELSIPYIRDASKRFRIGRLEVQRLFNGSLPLNS